jgi:hypothetical protein
MAARCSRRSIVADGAAIAVSRGVQSSSAVTAPNYQIGMPVPTQTFQLFARNFFLNRSGATERGARGLTSKIEIWKSRDDHV